MTLPMFQLVKCPRCPTGSCLSQEPPPPAELGPLIGRVPLLAVPRNTREEARDHGLGLFLVLPPNASHHTAALLRVRCNGGIGALVKKQREPEPPLVLSYPADPPCKMEVSRCIARAARACHTFG